MTKADPYRTLRDTGRLYLLLRLSDRAIVTFWNEPSKNTLP